MRDVPDCEKKPEVRADSCFISPPPCRFWRHITYADHQVNNTDALELQSGNLHTEDVDTARVGPLAVSVRRSAVAREAINYAHNVGSEFKRLIQHLRSAVSRYLGCFFS